VSLKKENFFEIKIMNLLFLFFSVTMYFYFTPLMKISLMFYNLLQQKKKFAKKSRTGLFIDQMGLA